MLFQFACYIDCGRRIAPGDFLGSAFGYYAASVFASFGSHVYNMVGAFQYIEVVFDDEHCVSALDKLVDDAEKHVYVLKVQSGRRFVKDEQRPFSIVRWQASHAGSHLPTVCLKVVRA